MDILNDPNAVVLQGLLHKDVKHHVSKIEAHKDHYRFLLKNKKYVAVPRDLLSTTLTMPEIAFMVALKIKQEVMSNVFILGVDNVQR